MSHQDPSTLRHCTSSELTGTTPGFSPQAEGRAEQLSSSTSAQPEHTHTSQGQPSTTEDITETSTTDRKQPSSFLKVTWSLPNLNEAAEATSSQQPRQAISVVSSPRRQNPPSNDSNDITDTPLHLQGKEAAGKSVLYTDGTGASVQEFVVERMKKRTPQRITAYKIFTIDDCVQLFYIAPDGTVEIPEDTSSLYLVKINRPSSLLNPTEQDTEEHSQSSLLEPVAFLHVGNWIYPLIPGYSPALISSFGTYIFPDLKAKQPGAAVALALPHFITPDEREWFEILLAYYAFVEDAVDRVREDEVWYTGSLESYFSEEEDEDETKFGLSTLSTTILMTLMLLVTIIVSAITLLTHIGVLVIRHGASLLRSRAARASRVHDVDPNVLRGVLYAKSASDHTVILTGHIVQNLHETAMGLSRQLAPRPSMLMPQFLKRQSSALGSLVRLVAAVSVGAYGGVEDVYKSLGDAANILMDTFSEEAAKTVEYRYGDEYGNLTREVLGAAVNVKRAVGHAGMITSLAFVPHTIRQRAAERIEVKSANSIDECASPGDTIEDSFHEIGSKDKKSNKQKKEKSNPKLVASGSGQNVDHAAGGASPSSLFVRPNRPSLLRRWWGWSSSTQIDPSVMRVKAVARKDSDSTFFWAPKTSVATRKVSSTSGVNFGRRVTSSTSYQSGSRHRISSTEIRAQRSQSRSLSRTTIGESYTLLNRRFTEANTSTHHSRVFAPTRRASIFLSHRRQSMHVTTALANVIERKYAGDVIDREALHDAEVEQRRNRFIAAASSVTRAKIRRRHRERSIENLLVVMTSMPRVSTSNPELKVG